MFLQKFKSVPDVVEAVERRRARWDSEWYARQKMALATRLRTGDEVLDWALNAVSLLPDPDGLSLEFGVGPGGSLRKIASKRFTYGFDSFEGLPEDWRNHFPVGYFALTPRELDEVRAIPNAQLLIGLFDETLPKFIAGLDLAGPGISFVHVDCDLYSSTVTVLRNIAPYLNHGAILLFDEYFNYPGWRSGEHQALCEWKDCGRDWDYVCYASKGQQVAIQIR